jgi:hypothetical protein
MHMNDPLWIDLTHPQAEQKIYVNMSLATRLSPGGPGAIIWFDKDELVTVRETPEEVFAAIQTAKRAMG